MLMFCSGVKLQHVTDFLKADIYIILIHMFLSWYTHCKAHKHIYFLFFSSPVYQEIDM